VSAAALGVLVVAPLAHASCGSAVCSINTDWSVHGVWSEPGARLDVRYESIVQDTLRHGTDAVKAEDFHHDHEERRTVNQNLITTLDYALSPNWGVSASVPIVKRYHEHIHDPEGEAEKERWTFTELGDARVLSRVQTAPSLAPGAKAVYGALFGLKLPTGSTKVKNKDDERAERTLQPGTGTTDLLLGGFWQYPLPETGTLFAQVLRQEPLNEAERYKPGAKTALDVGMRYNATHSLVLLIQVNTLWREKDSGDEVEPEDSGGRSVFVSPGIAYAIRHDVQLYAFYQWAAYQYVNGVQLTANSASVAGASLRF
jgi:hypothetical protein